MTEDSKPEITEMDVAKAVVEDGAQHMATGAALLDDAVDVAAASRQALAASAADAAMAEAAMVGAERSAIMSEAVGDAGIDDIAEGAQMLAASEDLAVIGTMVAAMSEDDLDHAMEIAGISGQLNAVGDLVASMEMPVLADFLWDRSDRLRELSVETMIRFSAGQALAEAIEETEEEIEELGVNEIAEGLVRLEVADEFAAEASMMATAGIISAESSLIEAAVSEELRMAALEEVGEAVSEIAGGAAEVGAGEMLALEAEDSATADDSAESAS